MRFRAIEAANNFAPDYAAPLGIGAFRHPSGQLAKLRARQLPFDVQALRILDDLDLFVRREGRYLVDDLVRHHAIILPRRKSPKQSQFRRAGLVRKIWRGGEAREAVG